MKPMTAHSKIRPASPADVAAHCPAAAIGQTIARLHARITEIDETPGSDDQQIEAEQIYDRLAALESQIQWVEARSLEGLYVQLLQMRQRAEGWAISGGGLECADRRAFGRLSILLAEGLPRLTGIDPEPLGKSHLTLNSAEFEKLLQMG